MHQLDKAIDSDGASIKGTGDYEIYWYFDTESEGRPLLFVHSVNVARSAIESPYSSTSEHLDWYSRQICQVWSINASCGHHDPSDFAKRLPNRR